MGDAREGGLGWSAASLAEGLRCGRCRPDLGAPIESAVRGLRDLLEGDASFLWAFVVLVIAFLVLRGSV
jgi:hypothetical protein